MISSLDNINSLNSVKRGASSISYGTFYFLYFFFRQICLKVSEKVVKGWALSSGSAYLPKFGQFSNNCNLDKVVLLCKRTFSSNFPPFFSLFFLQEDFPITNVFFLFLCFFSFQLPPPHLQYYLSKKNSVTSPGIKLSQCCKISSFPWLCTWATKW